MSTSIVPAKDAQLSLALHAQRIRDLVNVTRVCIVEVGRELTAAKEELPHGEWLPWLKTEFGWGKRTAENYMRVALKFASLANLDGITITGEALYLLSAPSVPQEVREEAVEKSKNGTVTLKAAKEMVAKAERDMAAEVQENLKELRQKAETETRNKVEEATKRLSKDNDTLREEIRRIKATDDVVTEQDAIALVKKLTGVRKLSMDQMGGICFALGKPLPPKIAEHFAQRVGPVDGADGKVHGPVDELDEHATWLWGRLLEVETKNILISDPAHVAKKMDEEMKADTLRIANKFSNWLNQLQRSLK